MLCCDWCSETWPIARYLVLFWQPAQKKQCDSRIREINWCIFLFPLFCPIAEWEKEDRRHMKYEWSRRPFNARLTWAKKKASAVRANDKSAAKIIMLLSAVWRAIPEKTYFSSSEAGGRRRPLYCLENGSEAAISKEMGELAHPPRPDFLRSGDGQMRR